MRVRVLFFGILKDILGFDKDSVVMADSATVQDLLNLYQSQFPALNGFAPAIAISVNQEYASVDTKLTADDEVAFLPPVSGGVAESGKPRSQIVRQRIESERLISEIKKSSDGALVVFEGIVRDHTRERATLYLDYEAYEEMAIKQMEELAITAISQFGIRDARIIHRLGRLEIGEISVLIIVASEHRKAAFEACHWLIDSLKRTVPIWKKEYFEDGAVWADGEPFPSRNSRH